MIGGGITGAGVALDAASRGLRTALVERDDFASGTSSKSSKLVHGGLRYLQQREVRLVYEALYERQRALENAPHLVRILPFLVPLMTRGGVMDRRLERLFGTALWAYDLTGGLRIGKRHHRIDVDTALAHMPTLARDRLAGGYVYYDAQVDDARLTLTIARTAAAEGAVVANHTAVRGLVKDGDRVVGARVTSDADGDEIEVRARVVVNAAGVWADDVRALDEGTHPASIRPAKGIHITLPWEKVRNDIAAIVPVPGDKRMVFVVPWGDTTYVGTTDTDYDGPLDDPPCTPADVDYLLAAINGISEEKLGADDVVGTWAGLRPLLRSGRSTRTADLSRKHSVRVAAERRGDGHRRQAHHLPPHGRRRGRRRRRRVGRRVAAVAHQAPAIVRGRGHRTAGRRTRTEHPRAPHRALRHGGRGRARAHRRGSRSRRTARARIAVPSGRGGLRSAPRDGAHARRRALAAHARARLLARDASADAAASVAELLAPELGMVRRRARRAGRRVPRRDRSGTRRDLVSPRS